MILTNKVALITGGKRIGAVVAASWRLAASTSRFSYARSKAEAEQAAAIVRAAGRRAAVFAGRPVASGRPAPRWSTAAAAALGRLDILINMASVYVQQPFAELTAADWDANARRRSARGVSLRARGRAAHAPAGRRPHRQLQRLGREERTAALPGLPAVLRREGRASSR